MLLPQYRQEQLLYDFISSLPALDYDEIYLTLKLTLNADDIEISQGLKRYVISSIKDFLIEEFPFKSEEIEYFDDQELLDFLEPYYNAILNSNN